MSDAHTPSVYGPWHDPPDRAPGAFQLQPLTIFLQEAKKVRVYARLSALSIHRKELGAGKINHPWAESTMTADPLPN